MNSAGAESFLPWEFRGISKEAYDKEQNEAYRKRKINELAKKFAIAFIHQGGNPDEANVKSHKLAEEYFELYGD